MRGALRRRMGARHRPGIIPADAGSTTGSARGQRASWDHPRGCGEHICRSGWNRYAKGSSPQMRGAPRPVLGYCAAAGIIPADAGSTRLRQDSSDGSRDHPRRCGEHPSAASRPRLPRGSSPRMRGALQRQFPHQARQRIIPADAGSTDENSNEPSGS